MIEKNLNRVRAVVGLAFMILFCGASYAQMTQTRLEHVTGDRDDYTAKTGGKTVAITTDKCLHKASDEDALYTAMDGKPYTINFPNGDSCKVLSFKEVKQ
jgi:hypothetical protein